MCQIICLSSFFCKEKAVVPSTITIGFNIQNSTNNMKRLFFWHRESTQYKCPVVACCGIGTWSWGGRAGGHSVSWHKLAAQAPWRHVSHHHWESTDRQTAGIWRWRSGTGERERDREEKRERSLCNIWCLKVYRVPCTVLKTAWTHILLQPAQVVHSKIQILPGIQQSHHSKVCT